MKRVLIVEDDQNELFTLTRVLERAGFEVTALSRGEDVLATLESAPHDLLITDLMMPGVDGLSIARLVAERHPELPIVLTSAFPMSRSQLDRLDVTGLHFLGKPLDLDRLLTLLGVARATTGVVPTVHLQPRTPGSHVRR